MCTGKCLKLVSMSIIVIVDVSIRANSSNSMHEIRRNVNTMFPESFHFIYLFCIEPTLGAQRDDFVDKALAKQV